MPSFESRNDYWRFAHHVRRVSRHFLDGDRQRFLEAVADTCGTRKGTLQKNAVLWRAQLGHDWRNEIVRDENDKEVDQFEMPDPFPPDRMRPLPDRAYEGRVNPKGIPCLYLSNDRETAMNETRPWIGSYVSVGQFVTLRDLLLVDCSLDTKRPEIHFDGRQLIETLEPDVWWSINQAFSEPVTRADDVADYAPTQVLAEWFRTKGFDGIVYGSKVGSGRTIALFDPTAAELAHCHLYQVEAVNLSYSMSANPYYVSKYAKGIPKEQSPGEAVPNPKDLSEGAL
jgi:RES domain-containing protein